MDRNKERKIVFCHGYVIIFFSRIASCIVQALKNGFNIISWGLWRFPPPTTSSSELAEDICHAKTSNADLFTIHLRNRFSSSPPHLVVWATHSRPHYSVCPHYLPCMIHQIIENMGNYSITPSRQIRFKNNSNRNNYQASGRETPSRYKKTNIPHLNPEITDKFITTSCVLS